MLFLEHRPAGVATFLRRHGCDRVSTTPRRSRRRILPRSLRSSPPPASTGQPRGCRIVAGPPAWTSSDRGRPRRSPAPLRLSRTAWFPASRRRRMPPRRTRDAPATRARRRPPRFTTCNSIADAKRRSERPRRRVAAFVDKRAARPRRPPATGASARDGKTMLPHARRRRCRRRRRCERVSPSGRFRSPSTARACRDRLKQRCVDRSASKQFHSVTFAI